MFRLKGGRLSATVVILALFSTVVTADQGDDAAFFQQRSQSAYNDVFGLPAVAARMVQTLEWQISLEHSNQFAGGRTPNERLLLDGETTRLAIHHRQRIGPCWQLEATLPFISHDGGVFDRSIHEWHDFFGLPDANRSGTDFGRLRYLYVDGDEVRHDISTPQSGIGDVQVALQHALGCQATADSTGADAILRAGMKLPTGEPRELHGSGGLDFFADWQSPQWSDGNRWRWAVATGVLAIAETDGFANHQPLALYGSVGAQFIVHRQFRLIAQLDGHTPFYRSALRELGDASFNVVFGARYLHARAFTFEFSFSEDAAIDTTPDIVARLALSYRPHAGR